MVNAVLKKKDEWNKTRSGHLSTLHRKGFRFYPHNKNDTLLFMKTACFVFLFLLFCLRAHAETYFFVGHSYPLLVEETENGDFSGLAADIAISITEKLGHTVKIGLFPWARAQRMVKTGEADVLMPPYKTPEREAWMDFTEIPFHRNKTVFFVRPDSTFTWDGNLASLRGKKIGMSLGWSFGAEFERAKDFVIIDYSPTIDSCFKKLLAKRVDMVPTQHREANASFERLGLTAKQKPVGILPEVSFNDHYFGFSKQKHKELLEFKKGFDRMLKQMKESGELSRLVKKYGLSGF